MTDQNGKKRKAQKSYCGTVAVEDNGILRWVPILLMNPYRLVGGISGLDFYDENVVLIEVDWSNVRLVKSGEKWEVRAMSSKDKNLLASGEFIACLYFVAVNRKKIVGEYRDHLNEAINAALLLAEDRVDSEDVARRADAYELTRRALNIASWDSVIFFPCEVYV